MNRLHHLKLTLPKNIENNLSYKNLEFVILDYNSSDGLANWAKETMSNFITNGLVKFYRTNDPKYFDRTHSRNMMFKLATGDIICNVDADNFTGENFAHYINDQFNTNSNIYLVADTERRYYFLRNAFGRFATWRNDFIKLGGLDESMKSYGSETIDFYERLKLVGKEESIIQNIKFLNAISHTDEERISNEYFSKNLEAFYIRYISSYESEVLFLYKNNEYEKGILIPDKYKTHLPASIKDGTWSKGQWKIDDKKLILTYNNKKNDFFTISINETESTLISKESNTNSVFYKITNKPFLSELAKNYSFITNNEQHQINKKEKIAIVNNNKFGQGIVFKNFDYDNQIAIN